MKRMTTPVWAASAALLLTALVTSPAAHATPARAQALGGYDLAYPNSINTFVYFEDDVNIFVNPALIYRYRDMVSTSLGFTAGSQSGMGVSPYGGFLIEPLDSRVVFGLFINRDPMLWGEGAAIQPVLNGLVPGGLGNAFDTGSQGGLGMTSVAPVFPLDLFVGGNVGLVSLGLNAYIMGGGTTGHAETLLSSDPAVFSITDDKAKSFYGGVRLGMVYDGDLVQPEVYAGYTGVAAWASTFAYDTENGQGLPSVSHTEGIKGVGRVLGGARVHVRTNYMTLTPHVGYATAWGKTFSDENLGDQTTVENLQNNDNRYSSMDLNGGLGLTYEPEDPLKVIWTVSAQVRRLRHRTDDHMGDLDVDPPADASSTQTDDAGTWFAGPVASVAAEYDAWRHLTLRAGVRANVLWGKNYSSSTAFYGTQLTETSNGAMDSGPTPSLAATAGISIPVGPVDLDATLGGLVMGGADMQFFSRLDMRIYLP